MTRRALVTGASRGLGRMLAQLLARQGVELVITARDGAPLDEVARELQATTSVVAVAGDVRDPAHRAVLANSVRGGLDLLVNNASVLGPTPLPALVDVQPDTFHEVFAANAVAPVALVAASLPALQSRGGLVVNVTSDAAVGGYPGWGVYGASKAALELLGKTLAAELSDVHVVTVDPGDMRTAMQQAAYPGEDISDRPLPEETLPFWAWLFGSRPADVDGRRLAAQSDVWRTGDERPEMWVS